MNYRDLPEELHDRIELARLGAERRFRQREKRLPGYTQPHVPYQYCPFFVDSARARNLLISRITTEVLEDAHEVCAFARQGDVKASDIGAVLDMILEQRCDSLCPDPCEYGLGPSKRREFLKEVEGILFGLPEWEAHLEEGAAVLKAQIRPDGASRRTSPFAWRDVSMRFTSELMVQVTLKDQVQPPLTYEDLGLADRRDRRSTKPNRAWRALQELARRRGTIESGSAPFEWARDWTAVGKRMQEVRRAFRKHFKTGDDPVPYVQGTGYQTAFRIDPGSALDT